MAMCNYHLCSEHRYCTQPWSALPPDCGTHEPRRTLNTYFHRCETTNEFYWKIIQACLILVCAEFLFRESSAIYVQWFMLTVTNKLKLHPWHFCFHFSSVWSIIIMKFMLLTNGGRGGFTPAVEREPINRGIGVFYVLHLFLLKGDGQVVHLNLLICCMLNRVHQVPAWMFRYFKIHLFCCDGYLLRDAENVASGAFSSLLLFICFFYLLFFSVTLTSSAWREAVMWSYVEFYPCHL